MQRLCKIILDYFSDSSITPSQYNVYLYGLKCLINELIANILLFSFAFIFNTITEIVFWSIGFLLLRTSIGGFHMKSHISCLIMSTLLGLTCPIINLFLMKITIRILIFIWIFSFVYILLFAPVEHLHHPLSYLQHQKLKKRSITIWCILFTLSILLHKYPIMSSSLTAGMIEATSLSLIAFLTNKVHLLNSNINN